MLCAISNSALNRKFFNFISSLDVMKFKEFLYYTLIFLFSLATLYILVFKTELLTERWFIGGIVAIIYLILKQLHKLIEND